MRIKCGGRRRVRRSTSAATTGWRCTTGHSLLSSGPGLSRIADRDRRLADIVQQPGLRQQLGVVAAHAGGEGEGGEMGGDAERMGEGVVVMRLQAGQHVAHHPRASVSTTCRPATRAPRCASSPPSRTAPPAAAEQAAGRADHRALQRRQPGPAPLQLAVDQLPDPPQQHAVGAGHRLDRRRRGHGSRTTFSRTSSAAPTASTSGRCSQPQGRRAAAAPRAR